MKKKSRKVVQRSFKANIEQYTPQFNTRIDFDDPINKLVRNLGIAGMSHEYIANTTNLSVSQVVLRLKHLGITVKQYRNGLNTFSSLLTQAMERQANGLQLTAKVNDLIVVNQNVKKIQKNIKK